MRRTISYRWTGRAIAFLLILYGCSCSGNHPHLSEYPPLIDLPRDGYGDLTQVSVILVGSIVRSSPIGEPRPSKWNERTLTQLEQVTVRVENVLWGSVEHTELPIYYFVFAGAYNGPRLLGHWKPGERQMFFLQKDSGVFRTVCDNYRHCVVPVLTGSHPAWKRDPQKYLADEIQTILLARGERCSDQDLLEAMHHPVSFEWQQRDLVRAFEQLAIHEAPVVQKAACRELAYLGDVYTRLPHHSPEEALLRSACGSMLKEHS